jgi:hypothetical protein
MRFAQLRQSHRYSGGQSFSPGQSTKFRSLAGDVGFPYSQIMVKGLRLRGELDCYLGTVSKPIRLVDRGFVYAGYIYAPLAGRNAAQIHPSHYLPVQSASRYTLQGKVVVSVRVQQFRIVIR